MSESTVSNTELSEFSGPHRGPGRELSEFLSAYDLCANANSPSLSQNSPSLGQNSVSPLFSETVLSQQHAARFLVIYTSNINNYARRNLVLEYILRELGSYIWPFLRSPARAPTIRAVRGTVAIKGVVGNSKGTRFLLGGGPFPLRGHRFPIWGDPFPLQAFLIV